MKKFVSEFLQSVKSVHPGGKNNMAIEFENGKVMISGHTTQYPVVSCKVDTSLSVEEVYNMVLDDNMSLVEFTVWVDSRGK
mgnify:CR=1 FL=1